VCCSTFYPPKSISISPSAEWMVVLFFRFFFSLSLSLGPFPPASPTLFSPATLVSSWHPPFPYNHFCSLAITFNSPLISLSPLLPGVTGRSHIHTKRTGDYSFIPQYSEMFSEPYPPSHWFSSLECSPFEKIAEGQERNKKKKNQQIQVIPTYLLVHFGINVLRHTHNDLITFFFRFLAIH
jgi:hypothetical protein